MAHTHQHTALAMRGRNSPSLLPKSPKSRAARGCGGVPQGPFLPSAPPAPPAARPRQHHARGGAGTTRGADPAPLPVPLPAPLPCRLRLRLLSRPRSAQLSSARLGSAMSADPVVFVSAVRTAVGERPPAPSPPARCARGCVRAVTAPLLSPPRPSLCLLQAPSTAPCPRCPHTSWAPPPSARRCGGQGWPPRRCRRWSWARCWPQVGLGAGRGGELCRGCLLLATRRWRDFVEMWVQGIVCFDTAVCFFQGHV